MFQRFFPVVVGFLSLWCVAETCAQTGVRPVGAGSYTTVLPPGARAPQSEIYVTTGYRGDISTNDWCSSLMWVKYSERQYPHPLAVRALPQGLQVYYPGPSITANNVAIFGFMPAGTGDDLILGHTATREFPDARAYACHDWSVRARFQSGEYRMDVTYAHGSPYVYAVHSAGRPTVTFARPPTIWSGSADGAVLGVTVSGRHYGLFGPAGSTWSGLDGRVFTNHCEGEHRFTLAVLPDASAEVLELFREHAHLRVSGTDFNARYDAQKGEVELHFRYYIFSEDGESKETLFALYPHQWRHTDHEMLPYEYATVRGTMKLARGNSFKVRLPYPGVLPALPDVGACDKALLHALIESESRAVETATKDTYWEGKRLGKMATLIPLAEQAGHTEAAKKFRKELQGRLENWFTAETPDGEYKPAGVFYYDKRWKTLIGYPANYGSDVELNDHHFHYGYFIRGAAEVARQDPKWAIDPDWAWQDNTGYQRMVELLIRDIANTDRGDTRFPRLRCFDPYAGHSWASGHAKFGDGNNNESSSEAMAAWCGMILWGEATGNRSIRDTGIILYAAELAAIEEYWFDVHGTNHHPDYAPAVVTMIWGGKGANETWFSGNPEAVHGINWLPFHGGSLYLGRWPDYVRKNYAALVAENDGTNWDQWADLIWMYRALVDPDDAMRQFEGRPRNFQPEAGNSLANTYHWISTLKALGQVDRSVTADCPLYAVFRKDGRRTYVVYNMRDEPRTITFSDGTKLDVQSAGFTVKRYP
jgi:endoglucanase Acf2